MGDASDLVAVLALVQEGQRALVARSTVKRFLTNANRQLAGAGDSVELLVEKLDDVFGEIAAKLRS